MGAPGCVIYLPCQDISRHISIDNCADSKHWLQGVQCPYAHGVYERNLHPSKYRTQLCTEGSHCTRHVCFFAHSPFQLRAPTHLWTVEEAVSLLSAAVSSHAVVGQTYVGGF